MVRVKLSRRLRRVTQLASVGLVFLAITIGIQPALKLTPQQVITLTIFCSTYALIILSFGNERTIIAMFGALLMWLFGVLPSGRITEFVDLHAIGLFFGVMIIAAVLRTSGFFKWLANSISKFTKMDPKKTFIMLSLSTALLSAFLDAISVIVFMTAITIHICQSMNISPKPFIMAQIFTANIGGSLTAIGSPPNIMILTAGELGFWDFLTNMSPVVLTSFLFFMGFILVWFRKEFDKRTRHKFEPYEVRDPWLFKLSLIIFGATIFFLAIHGLLGLHPTTIVLAIAIVALFVGGKKMNKMFSHVQWSTLLFFMSLFILVGGLEATGLLEKIANGIFAFAGENELKASMAILWSSAFISAAIDNIPLVATFIPIVKGYAIKSGLNIYSLWWPLAMGAGLGANAMPISGSPNIIALSHTEKQGYRISFKEFARVGFPLMIVTLLIAQFVLTTRILF